MPRVPIQMQVGKLAQDARRKAESVYPLLEPIAAAFISEMVHDLDGILVLCQPFFVIDNSERARAAEAAEKPSRVAADYPAVRVPATRRKPAGGR